MIGGRALSLAIAIACLTPTRALADLAPITASLATSTTLLRQLRRAATGPAGLKAVMNETLTVTQQTRGSDTALSTSKSYAPADVDQPLWQAELDRWFVEIKRGAKVTCRIERHACEVTDKAGTRIVYEFVVRRQVALLETIRSRVESKD